MSTNETPRAEATQPGQGSSPKRPQHRLAMILGCAAVALAIFCAANYISTNSHLVDRDAYDARTARELSEEVLANNLDGGFGQYRPFTGASVIRLDAPSDLQFAAADRLPHVDSATALLPLASAFVTATYPQEATTVGWEGSYYVDMFYSGHSDGFLQCYWQEDRPDETYRETYESFKARQAAGEGAEEAGVAGGAADASGVAAENPEEAEPYREGFIAGWEDALAAQAANVKPDTAEFWDREATFRCDASHDFPSSEAVFQYNNSSSGFQSLADGSTDVFFGTKSDEYQQEYAREQGVEFEYTPIGREGFVFLVNAANPVDSLTIEQVKGIYSGKITNWKQVGGNDEPIIAYQRNANSGSQSMMVRFMGDVELMAPLSKMQSSGSMGGLVKAIADYDNGAGAIGYSFRYYVTDLVGEYDVKLLAIEGSEPTLRNIENGSYPIAGEFYAATRKGDADENLARLIEWIRGPQGQELVAKAGYARL